METEDPKIRVRIIVEKATALKDKYTYCKNVPVNYTCIFSQNEKEYRELAEAARKTGKVVKETPTGPHIPHTTVADSLRDIEITEDPDSGSDTS